MDGKRRYFTLALAVIMLLAAGGGASVASAAQTLPAPAVGVMDGGEPGDAPSAPADNWSIYLPQMLQQKNRIAYGRVTAYNTPPIFPQTLLLRYYDGVAWGTYATGMTDAAGNYYFDTVPPLGPNQAYYVRWNNSNNGSVLNWLWYWSCYYVEINAPPNTSYCNFDLEDVYLLSPPPGERVLLPYTFQWQARQQLSDSYEFDLFDPADDDPYFYTPLLGYTNAYLLAARPAGFINGVDYGWDIWVYSADGWGISHYYNPVRFRNGSPRQAGDAEMRLPRSVSLPDGIPLDSGVDAWRPGQ